MNAEKKITFESFTERVAKRANVSESEADAYIHQFAKTASDALEEGDEVQLYHFGRFRTTHVDERQGSNPNTGEALMVPDHTRVDFQPYKALLIAVNLPFRHLRTRMLTEEETEKRPGVIIWLLLALALLALILAGIGISIWMSSPDTVTPTPLETPAAIAPQQPAVAPQQPAIELTPVAPAAEADTTTSTVAGTETDAIADTATDAAVEPIATTTNIVVAPGDTLWGISQAYWGDTSWWPVIYAENRPAQAARNPDLIEAGSSLRIPVLAGTAAQPADADLRQKASAYRAVADDYERLGHARAGEYRRFVNREFDGL